MRHVPRGKTANREFYIWENHLSKAEGEKKTFPDKRKPRDLVTTPALPCEHTSQPLRAVHGDEGLRKGKRTDNNKTNFIPTWFAMPLLAFYMT